MRMGLPKRAAGQFAARGERMGGSVRGKTTPLRAARRLLAPGSLKREAACPHWVLSYTECDPCPASAPAPGRLLTRSPSGQPDKNEYACTNNRRDDAPM